MSIIEQVTVPEGKRGDWAIEVFNSPMHRTAAAYCIKNAP